MGKSSLKKALLETKELEEFALNSAKEEVIKTAHDQIKKTVNEAIKEIEEGVTISVEDGQVDVEVDANTEVSLKKAADSGGMDIAGDALGAEAAPIEGAAPATEEIPAPGEEPIEGPPLEDETAEMVAGDEGPPLEDELDDETIAETQEQMFEVVDNVNEGIEDDISSTAEKMDQMVDLLGTIADKIGGESSEGDVGVVDDEDLEAEPGEDELGEFPPEGEEGEEELGELPPEGEEELGELPPEGEEGELPPEGDEEIVDDEELAEGGEVVYEFDSVINPGDITNTINELDNLDELDINFGEDLGECGDEDEMYELEGCGGEEEMYEIEVGEGNNLEETGRGLGHSQQRTGNRTKKMKTDGSHAPVTALKESKDQNIIAHYESVIDELKKENQGFKKTLKEYKDSFVVLRKQINEVETYNAKLAYLNQIFAKGGMKNDEKRVLAEQFEVCNSPEEAKQLYNDFMKKHKIVESKTPSKSILDKAANISVTAPSSNTLYESDELKRMRKLAGIL